jgi:flagellar protein FlbD
MIKVTGLNNKEFIINAEQIEIIEEVPECVITLVSGKKYIVLNSSDELIEKVINYKNRIFMVGYGRQLNE